MHFFDAHGNKILDVIESESQAKELTQQKADEERQAKEGAQRQIAELQAQLKALKNKGS